MPILFLTQIQPTAKSSSLAFKDVTVIDPDSGDVKYKMTVVVHGNRIADVGPTLKIQIPDDSKVIDASGKFLIPGLWDMHVHIFGLKDYLKLFTANGITGVRIMWGIPAFVGWRKEIESGELIGPRLVIGSPIIDGPKPIWKGSISVSNAEEGRQAVAKVAADGADFVKVYSLLPRDAYFAIADESKKRGIPFAGHVPESVSVAEASNARQRSIEHLTGVLVACSSREEDLIKRRWEAFTNLAPDQTYPSPAAFRPLNRTMIDTFNYHKATALFALLKKNHTWQCPTLTVLRSSAFLNDPNFRNDPRLKYLPSQMTAAWDPTTDFRFKERTAGDFELSRLVFAKLKELVGMMQKSGVEFLAGTDTPNPYCFPGFSLHDELALMVEAGITPMEALKTATINPARFLGIENSLGTIKPGKLADLILLDANPLQDIRNTQKIEVVVSNGRLLDREALDRMLSESIAASN